MFQTEPILFLQSFASDWLTGMMTAVSRMAYPNVLAGLVILVSFGLNLRAGMVLAEAVLWTELLTGLVKGLVGLPRPSDVDRRVNLLVEGTANDSPFIAAAGISFFDLPQTAAVEAVRARLHPSFGFPSSAVSTTAAFWGGTALVSRSSRMVTLATTIILLTALSRLYLGRHFLADVAAGAVVGLVVVGALRRGVLRPPWYFKSPLWPVVLALLPLAALLALPHVDPASAGGLGGLYIARMLLRDLPRDSASGFRRLGRVAVAGAVWGAIHEIVVLIPSAALGDRWTAYLSYAVMVFTIFWGGARLCERVGLYRRARPVAAVSA
ncbi:MAG TPA: phosphatase PAP2 family protein [Gemmatimonadales bacterium]|nr:phosphatase PAP2 family protein [Gemmatimonadales bacterium]